MTVREGMDVERVRTIAGEIGDSGERLRAVHAQGSASLTVLHDAWAGSDLGSFSAAWTSSASQLEAAAGALRGLQHELLDQADEQEEASGGTGGGGSRGSRAAVDDLFGDLFGHIADGDGDVGWRSADPFGGLGDAWDRGTDGLERAWDWGMDRGRDAVDWGVDRGRDAIEWGQDGLEWLGDRGEDLWNGARGLWNDEVVARWDAGVEGLRRLGPSAANFAEQFTQIVTDGRWPRFHEVLASGILLTGRTIGLGANVASGEDHKIFHTGEGVVTSELSVAADPAEAGRVPRDLKALMDIQTDTYNRDRTGEDTDASNQHVRVTALDQPDGSSAYIVTVPGTNGLFDFPGSITGGDEAFDNTSNLELQAGQRSASTKAVIAAMEEAGIPPDAPVMVQGHSQGGMIAGELMLDQDFMGDYNVTHVITAGSPNDSRSIPPSVRALALEHTNDPVPMLDFGDAYAGPPVAIPTPGMLPPVVLPLTPIPNFDPALAGSGDHVTQVKLDPESGTMFGSGQESAHHYKQYSNTVGDALENGHPGLTNFENSPGMDAYLTDDPDAVTITEYGTERR